MAKLIFLQDCLVQGTHAEAGTVIDDIPSNVAIALIMDGRARPYVAPDAQSLVERDPDVEHRDPKTKRRK